MRFLIIAAAATLLMLPVTRQANACEGATPLAQVTTTELLRRDGQEAGEEGEENEAP